jgi:hypothetical protein
MGGIGRGKRKFFLFHHCERGVRKSRYTGFVSSVCVFTNRNE